MEDHKVRLRQAQRDHILNIVMSESPIEDNKIQQLPDKPIDKTFYLIGDAGKSPINGYSKGLKAFKSFIKNKKIFPLL